MLNGGKMQRTHQGDFVKKLLSSEETAAGANAVVGDFGGNLKCFPSDISGCRGNCKSLLHTLCCIFPS